MYRMDSVPVTEAKRRIPMDVLVVLRWARAMIDAQGTTNDWSDGDLAHYRALEELCEEAP